MKHLSASDVAVIRAAASLAAHAPDRMHAAHLTARLEDVARRLEAELAPANDAQATGLLRAA
jgi:hypothetical protein